MLYIYMAINILVLNTLPISPQPAIFVGKFYQRYNYAQSAVAMLDIDSVGLYILDDAVF